MSNPASRPTAAVLTLGCKLNIADSEAMARQLRDAGWTVVDRPTPGADAVIVNTCSITHVADRKSRHLTRLAQRLSPAATVAVTGCLIETSPPETLDKLDADFIRRQPDQAALVEELIELRPGVAISAPASTPPLRTRAFVSAQEGCNDVCAFCIVPRTRGRERSKPIADVVAAVREREAEGVQEVVITGTQLGAYGRDRGEAGPAALLAALLAETKVPRIRMSSLQPQDISPTLVELWRDRRLCRHFHLALQSGSEPVLRRMRRRYAKDEYREAVTRLRAAVPDVAITTDVIAGFPGESDAEFAETYEFCREMGFAGMHVFPYSQRIGTLAEKLPSQVDEAIKKARVHELIALGDEMATAYRSRYIGWTMSVLWESRRERDGQEIWEGLTDTYKRAYTVNGHNLTNQLTDARLIGLYEDGLWAEVTA